MKNPPAPLFHGESLRRSPARVSTRKIATFVTGLVLLWTTGCHTARRHTDASPGSGSLDAGVGSVDITPTEPVSLAGSPTPLKSSSISSRLYARALVLSDGRQKAVIVTLDTLKYPVEHSQRARQQIEKATGIPVANIIICSSHTHRGPLWSYYPDQLVTPITDAVVQAVRDLSPCTLGMSKGRAEGVSECRRVIKDGHAWNRWQLKRGEADQYPAEGPADPEFDMLAVTAKDGRHKAIVYNFACHAANTRDLSVSADFPADVQQHVQKHLGYEVTTLFLTGACGDINPIYSVRRELFGEKLGGGILQCLDKLDPISKPELAMECREFQMPGREHPELKEAEIARNWPKQLEHYKAVFYDMKKNEKPSYQYFITGIRIGDDFAIVTNANELFCGIGMSIKRQSPFKHTMTAEQTNGAYGYVPTAKAFEGGSYETWFGEHSRFTTKAGEIIERESLDILRRLKNSPAAFAAGGEGARGELKVGFSQVDITPPVGTIITGPDGPPSLGMDDPLRARAMVVQSGNRKLTIVGLDLVKIRRDLSDQIIALVTQQTDITRDAVLVCPSHNHSSPLIPAQGDNFTANKEYIDTLPKLISDCIVQANKALQPARMSVGRSLVYDGHVNRRVISKADGLVLNNWLKKLNDLKQVPQVLGSESVTDPELWVVRFDALDGKMMGTLVNFTCHPALHDRIGLKTWSADFPGVIADQIAQAYGKQAVTVFTQGCSGNIQPPVMWTPDWKERSAVFAKAAVDAAKGAIAVEGPVVVDYARRDVDVPRCNAEAQHERAIARLGWRPESFEGAKRTAAAMPRTLNVPVSAARIGQFAIATNAGELFVEWGLSVKKRSPFPHTIVSELTNDWIGYEPTEQAFAHEGYETLAGVNFVSLEGIQMLMDTAVELLQKLWKEEAR